MLVPACPHIQTFLCDVFHDNTKKNKTKTKQHSRHFAEKLPTTDWQNVVTVMIGTAEAFPSRGWIQYCVCIGINVARSQHALARRLDWKKKKRREWNRKEKKTESQRARTLSHQCCIWVAGGGQSGRATQTCGPLNTHAPDSAVHGRISSVSFPQQRETASPLDKPGSYDDVVGAAQ